MPSSSPLIVVVLLLGLTAPASAGELRPFEQRVRTYDTALRGLMRHGYDTSPSFRGLVDRIVASDVIVMVVRQQRMSGWLDGRLSFLSATGGVRYLAVELGTWRSSQQTLATIAHELQHAVEIADAPQVVDAASLAREYERIGVEHGHLSVARRFDTKAAVEAGARVYREYVSAD